MLYFIHLIVIFLLTTGLHAAVATVSGLEKLSISASLYGFVDMAEQTDPRHVYSGENDARFKKLDTTPSFGYLGKALWLRLDLKPAGYSEEAQRLLLLVGNPMLDSIDIYIPEENSLRHYQSGDQLPYDMRAVKNRQLLFPLTVKEAQRVYLRVQTTGAMQVPIKLYTPEAFERYERVSLLFKGMFYGIVFILLLYSLILFTLFGDRNYLYYALFIVAYTLWQLTADGLAFEYLWPKWPMFNREGVLIMIILVALTSIGFGRSFMQTQRRVPKSDSVLRVLFYAGVILGIGAVSVFEYFIAIQLITLYVLITPWALFITALRVYKDGYRPARFYLWGWGAFLSGSFIYTLSKIGALPSYSILDNAQEIGLVIKVVCVMFALAERVKHLTYYDELTGLPNRMLSHRNIEKAIAEHRRESSGFALLHVDLDNFKMINESKSHLVGDALLVQVAKKIALTLKRGDMLAHIGSDEFLLLLLGHQEDSVTIAQALRENIEGTYNVPGSTLYVSASIGIAVFPSDGDNVYELMKNVHNATTRAKEAGKNCVRCFNIDMQNRVHGRLSLEMELRLAVEQDQFMLHYQPQIRCEGMQLSGMEALLRWKHPQKGMIPPDHFIPVAEESGLIVPIGRWVIFEAFSQCRKWQEDGLRLGMAINLSMKQFRHDNMLQVLDEALKQTGADPALIELEVTESIFMDRTDMIIGIIHAIKLRGFKFSIDDFGTGYSSLAYLKDMPADTLKIDKSFISDIDSNDQNMLIVKSVLTLAKGFGLGVVAEGVERAEQVKLLRALGCDMFQGYFFDRPAEAGIIDLERDYAQLMIKAESNGYAI